MLIWCSACLHFICEAYPYDKLYVSYATCARCSAAAVTCDSADAKARQALLDIYARLNDAGRKGDLTTAKPLIEEGLNAGFSATDILFGMIAPMLYQVGVDWEEGKFTVEQEHQFTAFCEDVVTMLSGKAGIPESAPTLPLDGVEALLMNARGNRHTIALRILYMKLVSDGVRVRTVDMPTNAKDVARLLDHARPKRLLISLALAD